MHNRLNNVVKFSAKSTKQIMYDDWSGLLYEVSGGGEVGSYGYCALSKISDPQPVCPRQETLL